MATSLTAFQVLEIVRAAQTRIQLDALTPSASLRDIGADSLDMMTILLDVQTAAGVEIPDADVGKLTTVDSIVEYVSRLAS
ncbi:MAG: acyl carrier protein [Planctomycetes bacterium]|nr:acyl carrier protein [Planctomycetota bacterium]